MVRLIILSEQSKCFLKEMNAYHILKKLKIKIQNDGV